MNHVMRALIVILCVQTVHAAEPAKKRARKAATNTAFEHRFSDDLKQTADSEARLDRWFRDAKFGAFVHFGVYSALEGEYQGRGSQHRYSEWIQVSGKIPADEYHQVAATFNPAEFDAEAWAKVFKDSGIRYVVITSKHHDGFALCKSMVSDYNIVDYTPFRRDIIKELSEACHRNGLKFGVYYSQAQDWDEPDAPYIAPRLEGTRRNPLPTRPQWGDVAVSKDGKTLYLHILQWPESGTITVNDLPAAAASAVYLANGENADFVQESAALAITLPAKPLNEYDSVVKVGFTKSIGE